jgi:hypothetical protein
LGHGKGEKRENGRKHSQFILSPEFDWEQVQDANECVGICFPKGGPWNRQRNRSQETFFRCCR